MQNVEISSTTSLTSLFQPGFPVTGVWLVCKASCFLYSSAPHSFIQSFQQLSFTDEEARFGVGRVSLRSVLKSPYLAIGDSATSDYLEFMFLITSHGAYYGQFFLIFVEVCTKNMRALLEIQAGALDLCVGTTLCLLRYLTSLLYPQMIKL